MSSYSFFKDLDIDLLRTLAKEWVDHFKEINIDRIELRRYSKPLKFAAYSGEVKTIYAIVFWALEQKENLFEEVTDGVQSPPYKQFVARTQYLDTIWPKRYAALVGTDFKKVYRRGSFPGDNYLNEWIFIPLAQNEALPLNVDNKTPPFVLYQNMISSTSSSEKQETNNSAEAFPCPPGTKWEQVKMTLVNNEVVRIKTPIGRKRYSYQEIGLLDGRSKTKPTMLWTLLKTFAECQGSISSKSKKYDPALPDAAKRLNKHLQNLFGIRDSIYSGHYKSEKGYRTKLFFSDETGIIKEK